MNKLERKDFILSIRYKNNIYVKCMKNKFNKDKTIQTLYI